MKTKKQLTGKQILKLPMDSRSNDAEAETIREYLVSLLRNVWLEGEGFSGKRPFGNSGWEYDLYIPLINAGLIDGKLDEDGFIEKVDSNEGRALILMAINGLD